MTQVDDGDRLTRAQVMSSWVDHTMAGQIVGCQNTEGVGHEQGFIRGAGGDDIGRKAFGLRTTAEELAFSMYRVRCVLPYSAS